MNEYQNLETGKKKPRIPQFLTRVLNTISRQVSNWLDERKAKKRYSPLLPVGERSPAQLKADLKTIDTNIKNLIKTSKKLTQPSNNNKDRSKTAGLGR